MAKDGCDDRDFKAGQTLKGTRAAMLDVSGLYDLQCLHSVIEIIIGIVLCHNFFL